MKKIALVFISTLISLSVFAQAKLEVEIENHDFGTIEEGVIAEYEFKFKNTGNAPLILSNVQASCGCTTPSWTKDPIEPGKVGTVKASYNSNGRPGAFNKSITITSNGETPTKVVYIKGNVNKKPEKPAFTPEELAASPIITLKANEHSFPKLEKNQKVTKKFNFTNTGKSDLVIKEITSSCNCFSFEANKPSYKPGESGIVTLTYTPRTTGNIADVATLVTNDLTNPKVNITIKANVVESLNNQSIMKEEKGAVPFK
jgi:hypothetical protein